MADILEFPSRQAQGLAFLERELRALLTARGADERLIEFAVSQLTGTYTKLSKSEQYDFSVELPASVSPAERDQLYRQINAGLEGIRRENHALMVELVARLVLAELRLFQHERSE
ncbi:MAG: hypothetical protein KDI04_06390 [Halieaceae bacterium]|nr:hypothetical protein [Halieaceae bacterium]MCP5167932.1 hypothetical protein [Pseudomonadales bacterium]MCP5188534.1 hypothetical protein [Pseudomonadales bacterium]